MEDLKAQIKEMMAAGDPLELRRVIASLQGLLYQTADGRDAMDQCARRHGWNGQLEWVDLEGNACVWPDPAGFAEMKGISKLSVAEMCNQVMYRV